MPVVLAVGWLIGRAFYWFDGPHRRRAMRNLHAAFPLRSRSECRAIARGMFSHFGRLLTVFLKFSTMTPQQMLARVSFERGARPRRARPGEGRAALHRAFRLLGDQRARARGRAQADVGARAPARQPAAPSVARIDAAEDRQRRDLPARRDSRVLRALESNEAVAVLIDQHIHTADAVYVDFFNRPAATTSALAALALRTGAPVVPVFARCRFRAAGFAWSTSTPSIRRLPTIPTRSVSSPSAAPTSSRCAVRRYPELWLWMHRRWRDLEAKDDRIGGMFPAASSEEGNHG